MRIFAGAARRRQAPACPIARRENFPGTRRRFRAAGAWSRGLPAWRNRARRCVLPRLNSGKNDVPMPPRMRVLSPAGGSTLMTSAPSCARIMPQVGPITMWVISMTLTPVKRQSRPGHHSLPSLPLRCLALQVFRRQIRPSGPSGKYNLCERCIHCLHNANAGGGGQAARRLTSARRNRSPDDRAPIGEDRALRLADAPLHLYFSTDISRG